MWWVLLATLGNDRPHPVVQDWVHRHFDASAFYSQGPDRPKLHERALTACLIHEDWRMGHAASDATSEAIRQVNDAVKAAADATANAATAAKLQLDIEAAQPHLPEEPIRSLMLSYTLKYRGAKSCWFAELESRKVVALHRSVVDACIEPAFRIKCWEAFVAVTAESLTMYGREVIHVVSDGPAVGQERPPSDPLPDGVNWDVYKRDDLLGIGCARKGDLGFREGASQPTEQWRVYYESNERTLSILLKGVLGTNQYKKSGKGSVADAISSDRGNAKKAKTPRSTQLPALHCPTAPLLLTHKLPVATAHPPKRSKSSHSSTTATANVADSNAGGSDEPPPPKRPKRAAAEKADKNFGAYDEVGVGEDGESGTDDFDESESDQSEIEVSKKRAKATGAMTSQKSARGAETMAVPTDVVMGTTPSMEPIPAQVERIKKALGLDASLTIPAALDAAETLLGRKAEGGLSHRATAVLAVVEELRGKVQRITPYARSR